MAVFCIVSPVPPPPRSAQSFFLMLYPIPPALRSIFFLQRSSILCLLHHQFFSFWGHFFICFPVCSLYSALLFVSSGYRFFFDGPPFVMVAPHPFEEISDLRLPSPYPPPSLLPSFSCLTLRVLVVPHWEASLFSFLGGVLQSSRNTTSPPFWREFPGSSLSFLVGGSKMALPPRRWFVRF